MVILVVVAAVITWDLTTVLYQQGAWRRLKRGGCRWLVGTLDNQSDAVYMMLHDLSSEDFASVMVNVPEVSLDSSYALQEDRLVATNATTLFVLTLKTQQRPDDHAFSTHEQLLLCEQAGSAVVAYTVDGVLDVMNLQGVSVLGEEQPENIRSMTCSGSEIAYVSSLNPMEVNILQLGVRGEVGYTINATAPVEEDDLLASWGTPVDMDNASIQTMAFNREYLAVTVNVSATDRLVLYNRTTAEQWLASNPKYHVSDLSLDHGILAWSVRDHLNPLNPKRSISTVKSTSRNWTPTPPTC